jgi:hypothetical protein
MLIIVFISTVIASALNAASSVLEREAAGTPDVKELFTKQLGVSVAKNKKFISGIGLQLTATLMEIIALSQGTLELVAPLLTLDLVFLLIFLSYRYHLKVKLRNWVAVVSIVLALSGLFLCTRPSADQIHYTVIPWLIAVGVVYIVIASVISIVPRMKSSRTRAGLLALATASSFGLDSGLLKLALNQLKSGGLENVILSWPLYVLIFTAAVSVYLTQNTLSAGPLVVSQPIIEIVQPTVSVAIGIFIFNDDILNNALAIVGDAACTIVLLAGIIVLARADNLFVEGSRQKTI